MFYKFIFIHEHWQLNMSSITRWLQQVSTLTMNVRWKKKQIHSLSLVLVKSKKSAHIYNVRKLECHNIMDNLLKHADLQQNHKTSVTDRKGLIALNFWMYGNKGFCGQVLILNLVLPPCLSDYTFLQYFSLKLMFE